MIFKSDKPVYCRSCGDAVSKVTHNVFVLRKDDAKTSALAGNEYRGTLRTKVECQGVIDAIRQPPGVNLKVVHVSKRPDGTIDCFSTWDGVSYKDQYFCTNNCAICLGVAAARTGMCMPAYNARISKKPKVAKKARKT